VRRHSVDANQADIVSALRRVGAHVCDLSAAGKGIPDLIVYFRGELRFLELKDGSKPPSARKLTPAQKAFHAVFPVTVVTSPYEALRAIGIEIAK